MEAVGVAAGAEALVAAEVVSRVVADQAGVEVRVEIGKFTASEKAKIISAIAKAEASTSGEIRIHASYSKTETDVMMAAKAQFDRLRMADTKARNGILLYVNPILKKFAIFGDQGIHEKVGHEFWEQLAKEITHAIRERNRAHGMVHAILRVGDALRTHFPEQAGKANELSNEPTESE